MMGMAGMRSAWLPVRASLKLEEARILTRLTSFKPCGGRVVALFDYEGGRLRFYEF